MLSRKELVAWIDLVIPFRGDYVGANAWDKNGLRHAEERIGHNRTAKANDHRNIEHDSEAGQ